MKSKDDRISDKLWEERMKSGNIEQWDRDHEIAIELVNGLRRSSVESEERSIRYDKIYEIERTKWPYGMGSIMRNKIPENLHPKLDECITNSQNIAREACQTEELTNEYLKNNSKQKE